LNYLQVYCNYDNDGIEYNTLHFDYIAPYYCYFIQVTTEAMILANYFQKIEHYHNRTDKVRIFKYKIFLAFCTLLSGVAFLFEKSYPLYNLFFISFLAVHT
jgi:hypothetical protein